eukprot:CAMPEP_0167759158 /NCGR_PEP_ID=MMETSP0110_2-20121227/10865_1 /TAXON_ID=629695 /ORGANISM="Gymnochlora sp., Strain CCMP2014" /LENGTH=206 /DNA_ID=CAMNT_0007645507 /DNA_START=343 /DNA_END=963 /DNA_ORIENTATION=-
MIKEFPYSSTAILNLHVPVKNMLNAVEAVKVGESDAQSAVNCRERQGDEYKRQVSVGESSQSMRRAVCVAQATVCKRQPTRYDGACWMNGIIDIIKNVIPQLYEIDGKTPKNNKGKPLLHLKCHQCGKNCKFARFRTRGIGLSRYTVENAGQGTFTTHLYDHVPPNLKEAYSLKNLKDELKGCFKNYLEHFNSQQEDVKRYLKSDY